MSEKTINVKQKLRRNSATIWNSKNPVLADGEPGYDTTNNILKIGDGVKQWNNLKSINANNLNYEVISEIEANGDISLLQSMIEIVYPVGSIYLSASTNGTSPASIFPNTTWEALPADYALWIADAEKTIGSENEGLATDSTYFRKLQAGLPEISGSISGVVGWGGNLNYGTSSSDSAFVASDEGQYWDSNTGGSWVGHRYWLGFKASRMENGAIYGKSTTVQPKGYRVYAWRRVA